VSASYSQRLVKRGPLASLMAVTMALCFALSAVAQQGDLIPESEIAALQEELDQGMKGTSAVDLRRSCKSVIRKASNLIAATPEAENRFGLLAIIYQGQKKLLSLETTEQNRQDVYDTCNKLLKAPDEFVELRFEADMFLSERDNALNNASTAERMKVLGELVDRYRGTRAELRSLTIASMIASNLQAFDFEKKMQSRIAERFAGDHEAITFRQKSQSVEFLDVVFSGTYRTHEGSMMTFPFDRLGHQLLIVFWSAQAKGYEAFLGSIKEQQERFPGQFEVYSFNIDEMPDAGSQILRKLGLDWTALHLPGGPENSAYLAYAGTNLVAQLVNAQGHAQMEQGKNIPWPAPTPARGKRPASPGPGLGLVLDSDRYLAQLRHLLTGDFLVAFPETSAGGTIPAETLRDIQACFVPAPFCYRLSVKEALANYQKAEKLCAEALQRHPQAPDLRVVRDRRMVALMGLWNLAREPKYLEAAVKEAQATLALQIPPGEKVVSHFCLATEALRKKECVPEKVFARLLEETGGVKAPDSALAALAVLAIKANEATLYRDYRAKLLEHEAEAPQRLWPVLSFMRDRIHAYRLFAGNLGRYSDSRLERYMYRQWIAGVADPENQGRLFTAEFQKLDGNVISFPKECAGKTTGILFVDPPEDAVARSNLTEQVNEILKDYSDLDVQVFVAVLSSDTTWVDSFTKQAGYPVQPLVLPEGLKNPLVLRIGILSADQNPNQLLLRPDGTIAWMASGVTWEGIGKGESANSLAVLINSEKIITDEPFEALEKGEYQKALQLFEKRFPTKKGRQWWVSDCLQGRALAYMGLKDWNAALVEIEAALKRRIEDFDATKPCSCHGTVEIRLTKAFILEKLGQAKEAEAERELAAAPTIPHHYFPLGIERMGVPIGVYYDRLKKIRLAQVDSGSVKK
jgi:hypothetical protein